MNFGPCIIFIRAHLCTFKWPLHILLFYSHRPEKGVCRKEFGLAHMTHTHHAPFSGSQKGPQTYGQWSMRTSRQDFSPCSPHLWRAVWDVCAVLERQCAISSAGFIGVVVPAFFGVLFQLWDHFMYISYICIAVIMFCIHASYDYVLTICAMVLRDWYMVATCWNHQPG